jgi:hypothetical protein
VTFNGAAGGMMKTCKCTLQKWYFRNQVMQLWWWGAFRLLLNLRLIIMVISYRSELWLALSPLIVLCLCMRLAFQLYHDLIVMWGVWLTTMHELEKVTALRKANSELY